MWKGTGWARSSPIRLRLRTYLLTRSAILSLRLLAPGSLIVPPAKSLILSLSSQIFCPEDSECSRIILQRVMVLV